MGDLIERLKANPGLYSGPQIDPSDPSQSPPSVARISVAVLPGGSGVSLDYEVFSAEKGRVHAEHAMLVQTIGGLALVTAHNHGDVASVLRETEAGYFPAGPGDSQFPMAIRIEVPESGTLVYSWSYGMPGEDPVVRDVGHLTRVTGSP